MDLPLVFSLCPDFLDVPENPLKDEGLESLSEAIQANGTVRVLGLWGKIFRSS